MKTTLSFEVHRAADETNALIDETNGANAGTIPDPGDTIADVGETPAPEIDDADALADIRLPEPPRLTLRDIATESLIIDALLEQAQGELTPELEARMDRLSEVIMRKGDGVAAYIEGLEADAKVLKAEEDRLAVRRKALNNRAARFELFVKNQMIRMNRLSIEGDFKSLDVVNNPPKLELIDKTQLPPQFVRKEEIPATTVTVVLEDEIKAALMAREKALAAREKVIKAAEKKKLPTPTFNDDELPPDVPGAQLTRGTRLRIS
jgi:hypothetical protein